MTTTVEIQDAIRAAYAGIEFPGGLGTPDTGSGQLGGNPNKLPYTEVYRGQSTGVDYNFSTTMYTITRDFVVRIYIAKLSNDNARPGARSASMDLAANCLDTVHDHFSGAGHPIDHSQIISQTMVQDTGDTVLKTFNNDSYSGVAFRHSITYIRQKGT